LGQDKTVNRIQKVIAEINIIDLPLDSIDLEIDSIITKLKYNSSKLISTNFFPNHKMAIEIEYYFKDKQLIYITTWQESEKLNSSGCISEYYFKKGLLIKERRRQFFQGECIAYNASDFDHFCSIDLDLAFLTSYLKKIERRIKTEFGEVYIR
jgi:hypothetical protein